MNVAAATGLSIANLSFLGTHEIVRLPLCEETGSEPKMSGKEREGETF